jgi:hypothetical protein
MQGKGQQVVEIDLLGRPPPGHSQFQAGSRNESSENPSRLEAIVEVAGDSPQTPGGQLAAHGAKITQRQNSEF